MQVLRDSIQRNDVDLFHRHIGELARLIQDNERMKGLLQGSGALTYAAYVGSNPMVTTLIEKGVGKKNITLYRASTHLTTSAHLPSFDSFAGDFRSSL